MVNHISFGAAIDEIVSGSAEASLENIMRSVCEFAGLGDVGRTGLSVKEEPNGFVGSLTLSED